MFAGSLWLRLLASLRLGAVLYSALLCSSLLLSALLALGPSLYVDRTTTMALVNFEIFQARPAMALLATASVIWFCYLIGLAIYRLYFSPIAKFPGPKLAALTKWYECYWEVARNGRFTFHIQDLHKEYGKLCRSCGYTRVDLDANRTHYPHHTR